MGTNIELKKDIEAKFASYFGSEEDYFRHFLDKRVQAINND